MVQSCVQGVGDRQKNCDSTISCQNCGSETHHKVMCRVKKSENKKEKEAKDKNDGAPPSSSSNNMQDGLENTENVEDNAIEELPETTNNMGRSYGLLKSESYLLDRSASKSLVMTCVGTVYVKDNTHVNKSRPVQSMFDMCSTDSWITHELAKSVEAKVLPDWVGYLRTIRGNEKASFKAYQISVLCSDGKIVKLECLGTESIGFKPKIETCRFKRP